MRKGGRQGRAPSRTVLNTASTSQHSTCSTGVLASQMRTRTDEQLTAQASAPRASALQDGDTHLVSCAIYVSAVQSQ